MSEDAIRLVEIIWVDGDRALTAQFRWSASTARWRRLDTDWALSPRADIVSLRPLVVSVAGAVDAWQALTPEQQAAALGYTNDRSGDFSTAAAPVDRLGLSELRRAELLVALHAAERERDASLAYKSRELARQRHELFVVITDALRLPQIATWLSRLLTRD